VFHAHGPVAVQHGAAACPPPVTPIPAGNSAAPCRRVTENMHLTEIGARLTLSVNDAQMRAEEEEEIQGI